MIGWKIRGGALVMLLALPAVATAQYGPLDGLKIARPEDSKDVEITPPPPGAIVLLDGRSPEALERSLRANWVRDDGGEPRWEVKPSARTVEVRGGGIKSKHEYAGHSRLHVEFRVPYMPDAQGQGRGNSGVYSQGRYEVQILDSYGLDSQDNDCGGIYRVAKPLVNACKAPTVWQSYDVDFRAPVFRDGKKVEPARITVDQNGKRIHDDVVIPIDNTVSGLGGDPSTPGPVHLQDHGNPVQYRNIWLLPLD